MQKNLAVTLLIALMLCVMELGLLTHAVGHIQDLTSHGSTFPNDQDKNTTAEHCQQCLGYAQADAATLAPVVNLILGQAHNAIEKIVVARLTSTLTPTYSARAPPSSLS